MTTKTRVCECSIGKESVKKECPEIADIFINANVEIPDLVIYQPEVLDDRYREDVGIEFPVVEHGSRMSGCYAWIEAGELEDGGPKVMYVGKAVRLRNRLWRYWNESKDKLLQVWGDEREALRLSFNPVIAIWFTEDRSALEVELQRKLN